MDVEAPQLVLELHSEHAELKGVIGESLQSLDEEEAADAKQWSVAGYADCDAPGPGHTAQERPFSTSQASRGERLEVF